MKTRPHRRLSIIVSADVVGYSALMELDEANTLAELRSLHTLVIEPSIAEHEGKIVKTMGDGLLLEFASAVNGVLWAIRCQQKISQRVPTRGLPRPIRFRIGVHLGDIIDEGDDIFGDGVNLASRLQEIAEPGGISISGAVFDQITGKVDHAFEDVGYKRLKNIERSVRVYRAKWPSMPSETDSERKWPFIAGNQAKKSPITSGGCLCGRVRYDVWSQPTAVGYCHCRMCQLALGAPLNSWAAFLKSDVTFSGDPPKIFDSSPIARRAFCAECGTSLYTEFKGGDAEEYFSIRVATCDNPEDFPPSCHFGIESRLPWLNIDDDLPRIRTEDDEVLSGQWAAAGQPKSGPSRQTAIERFCSRQDGSE